MFDVDTLFAPYTVPWNEAPPAIGDSRTSDCIVRVTTADEVAPGVVPVDVITAPPGSPVSGHVTVEPVGGYEA